MDKHNHNSRLFSIWMQSNWSNFNQIGVISSSQEPNWISTHSDSTHFQNYASQVRDQVISSSLISDPLVIAPISDWISTYSDSTHFENCASQVRDQVIVKISGACP
ncbi:hypothetical protein CMV_009902 [Castanea mollissima]|uniref:Uncharacterized protein n=1 Tax=Castanea mollissima TaxID=60419 RepID=A0A8J4VQG5_9ROSI|nr:hypothetical protein CMV_009902 [Castanea mollissima]